MRQPVANALKSSTRKLEMQNLLRQSAALAMGIVVAGGAAARSAASLQPIGYPGVSARLEAPQRVRRGDSLALRLLVRNETRSPITLPMTWQGDQAFDPIVREASGRVVWQRSVGQYRSAVGERRTIPPHQTTTYRAWWNMRDSYGAPLPAGSYRITGRLIGGQDSVILSAADVTVLVTP